MKKIVINKEDFDVKLYYLSNMKKERVKNIINYIKNKKETTFFEIQNEFGYGDGVMERLHRIVREHPNINWYSKWQKYYWRSF